MMCSSVRSLPSTFAAARRRRQSIRPSILTLARMRIGARRTNERKKEEGRGRAERKKAREGRKRQEGREGASILASFGGSFGRIIRESSESPSWKAEEGASERATTLPVPPPPVPPPPPPKPQTLCEIAPSETFPDGVHGDGREEERRKGAGAGRAGAGRAGGGTDLPDIWKGSGCHCRRRRPPKFFSGILINFSANPYSTDCVGQ